MYPNSFHTHQQENPTGFSPHIHTHTYIYIYIYIKKSSSQPKWCLIATSIITTKMVSFFTSFHVLLVHIHKFKLIRLAATSKQENGRKLEEKESWPWSTKNKASLEKMQQRKIKFSFGFSFSVREDKWRVLRSLEWEDSILYFLNLERMWGKEIKLLDKSLRE